jgi:hypothetical protein
MARLQAWLYGHKRLKIGVHDTIVLKLYIYVKASFAVNVDVISLHPHYAITQTLASIVEMTLFLESCQMLDH